MGQYGQMDANTWRVLTAAGAAVTIASAVFAIGAAVSSSDDGGSPTATESSGTSVAATTADQQIVIDEFAFDPATLTVPAGSSIAFTNDDNLAHSVVSRDGQLASADLDEGDTYTVTLDQPGTVEYLCGIHDFMTGSITVSP
jgi:plastocyanin